MIWPSQLLLPYAAVYELHETASVLFYIALKFLFFLPQVEAKTPGMQVKAGGGTRREESEDQQDNRPYF